MTGTFYCIPVVLERDYVVSVLSIALFTATFCASSSKFFPGSILMKNCNSEV